MESIKFKNKYIDTEGIYDSNEGETQDKINSDLQFVDKLDMRFPLLSMCDVGYGSIQGLCVVDNRYIVVGRHLDNGSRDLMVFDVLDRKVKQSNIFTPPEDDAETSGTNVYLGHLGSMCFVESNGNKYIYIPRKEKSDIIRLIVNDDFTITYDSTQYEVGSNPKINAIAYNNSEFYYLEATTKQNKCFVRKSSDYFSSTSAAFSTTLDGFSAVNLTRQGLAFDGKYLYFSVSNSSFNISDSPSAGSSYDWQKLIRTTQNIIITDTQGNIIKGFSFPRCDYGEIEDIDLITLPGSNTLSIVIACNENDSHLSTVYICPLYRNSVKSWYSITQTSEMSSYMDYQENKIYKVYCDSRPCYTVNDVYNANNTYNVLNSNPFAIGLVQDKFTSIPAAIGYIKKLGFPVTLYISGKHGNMTYRGLRGINFVFDGVNTDVGDITINDSYGISLSFVNGATHRTINTGNSILYGEGNGNITVDSDFSSTSENPVQNKVIKAAMDAKADKVANATNGNFAALDANGNLIDSGHKHSDYLSTSDYNPDAKTSSMTKAVGKDANGKLWTEPVESSEVVSATGNWLSENITQETGYVIDDSLSTTGAAADAKATGDELSDLKSAVNKLEDICNEITDWSSGYIEGTSSNVGTQISMTAHASNLWTHAVIDCTEGDIFIISGFAEKTHRFYCFLDADNHILDVAPPMAKYQHKLLVAPSLASKLVIQQALVDGLTAALPNYKGFVAFTNSLTNLYENRKREVPLTWERGKITTSGYAASTNFIRSLYGVTFNQGEKLIITNCSMNYIINVYGVKQNTFKFFGVSGAFLTGCGQIEVDDWTYSYQVLMKYRSGNAETPIDSGQYVSAEIINNVYTANDVVDKSLVGFSRAYAYANPYLDFLRKTLQDDGTLADSTTNVVVEIPNHGRVEVKSDAPVAGFKIAKVYNNTVTYLVEDWSYYTYRYVGDNQSKYYAIIANADDPQTAILPDNAAYYVGVYTFADEGKNVRPSTLIGKHVAFIGDSITQGRFENFGSGVNNCVMKPFGSLIAEHIGDKNYGQFGIGGALVYDSDWKSLYRNCGKVTGYDVIFVCGGTNDFGRDITEDNFRAAFDYVITTLIANNSSSDIVVCSPIYSSRHANKNSEKLYLYDYAMFEKDIAEAHNLKFIDMYTPTNNSRFIGYCSDGLHPNEMGHRLMADIILAKYDELSR